MKKTNEELEKELQLMVKNIDQAKKVHEQCTTRLIQIQAILQDRASQTEEQKIETVETTVLDWVKTALGDQVAVIETELEAKVNEILTPTTETGVPWS